MSSLTLTAPRRPKPKPPAKPRRARGTGAFFWSEALGLYVGRVKVGRKPDGSPLYRERRARTQKELQEKLAKLTPPGPTTTLAEWAERWYAALAVRPSTRADYRHTLDRFVLPELGHVRLADLTPHHVEEAAKRWARRPGEKRGLGPNTARKNLRQLRGCLEAARRARIIPDNPARDARPPRGKRTAIDPFTAQDLSRLIAEGGIWAVLASVGLRLGEASALDVPDFDPAAGTLSISKTHDRRHGTRPPKSENGVRVVSVPAQALSAVKAAAGSRRSGPLFLSKIGTRRLHSCVQDAFRSLLKRLGLRYRSPHQLRHSVATVWVSKGVPIADVAKHLGDSLATVIRTYVHPSGVNPAAAMEAALGGR